MLHLQEYSAFKGLLRDFLVQTKSFSSQDNADLFAEETAQKQAVSVSGVSLPLCRLSCVMRFGIAQVIAQQAWGVVKLWGCKSIAMPAVDV